MVSLFGDMARTDGDLINGPVLSAIMAAMDVRPEAARVALHRLRNDHWITSKKQGRISLHSLTPEGRAQSQAASTRIYASPEDLPTDWQLIILEDAAEQGLAAAGFTNLQQRVYVGDATLRPPESALTLPGQDAPDWMKRQLEPTSLSDNYTQLQHALEHITQRLPSAGALTSLQIVTLRCLIVHNWRRLALKHPALPRPLMREDWPGLICQRLVANLLARYPRPNLSEFAPH